MKSLIRDKKGAFIVKSRQVPEIKVDTSPIVTDDNKPELLNDAPMPKKSVVYKELQSMTKEVLFAEMVKAGGHDLNTNQFAVMIVPCVKMTVDLHAHHKWDMAHSWVRSLARQLVKEGKIKMKKDPKSKQAKYVYTVI